MFEALKRLTKHSAVYGVGHIATRVVGFLLLPLYTNALPPAEFGIAALVFTYLGIMNVVYTYGLDAAFLRYYILAEGAAEKKRILGTAFLSLLVTSVVLSLSFSVAAGSLARLLFHSDSYRGLVHLASWILFFDAVAALPFLILRAEEKSAGFVTLKFLNVAVTLALNVWLIVYLKKGVEGIYLSNLLASAFSLVTVLPLLPKRMSLSFSRPIWGELLHFGLPYLPSGLAVVVLDLIDRVLLERLAGLEVTGIYNAGYKLGMFMAIFITAFRFAWQPFFLSTAKEANAKEIFSKVLTYFLLAGSAVFLVISLFIDEIVRLRIGNYSLVGREYWNCTIVVPVVMLSYLAYGMYVNFTVGIHLEKKTKYLPFITGLAAAVNIGVNFLLIPRWGMMGAAYATLIAYGLMAFLLYVIVQRFYSVAYEWGRIAKLALTVAGVFAAGRFFGDADGVFLKLALLLAFPILLLVLGFFERREVSTLKGLVKGLSW